LTGWDVVRGSCRDAGKLYWIAISMDIEIDVIPVLWNMLRGSKLNRPSIRSATKTSWADLFTFEKYVFNLS
jgi:hypothetical protein